MIDADFNAVLSWWFVLFLLGLGFLPLTASLFRKFFDKGYIFSKLIGLAITGYAVFLFGVLHITHFTMISSYTIFVLVAVGSILLLPKKKQLLTSLKQKIVVFLLEELFFFFLLLFWAYVHSFAPDIHGLEKYMDFGFINSILRSDYFPPKDMWFTPLYINYYYFGHFLTALLTRLSNLPSQITFNLMLSTVFAFCFVESFSLGTNLYSILHKNGHIGRFKRVFSGILTASLVTLAGNLHILYAFFQPYKADDPVPFWQLVFSPSTFPNSYWYPNATRFIYHTIHEFPIYSWVVADLHGHVLDIPFVLLTISLLFSLLISKSETKESEKTHVANIKWLRISQFEFWHLPLLGLLLAVMYMTNAWDGAIYLLLAGLVLFHLHRHKLATGFLTSMVVIVVSFIVFTLPYSAYFKPFVSGIGVLCAPPFLISMGKIGPLLFEANHCQHSYLWELLILYGFFYFFVVSFLFYYYKAKKTPITDTFVSLLILLSTLLIILPEFIYVKDIYPAHYRANTMFKLVFQAFIMLSISSGYIIVRLLGKIDEEKKGLYLKGLFPTITVLLLSLVMTYPVLAIKAYYNGLKAYRSLDGIAYLQTLYPSDYQAILWLRASIKGQPVILEAQGDSYTDYARVSANTGLPTVLGWTVHEWLWRGTYDIPAPRITEVQTLYETADVQQARTLLKKYHVSYVFIGALEYQKYPKLNEAKFGQLGMMVFQNGTTKIYKINPL